MHLVLLLFAGLLREERVRKKTESKQKGRKKVFACTQKKIWSEEKKAADDCSGRQRRQAKASKIKADRRKIGNKMIGDERKSLTQLQNLGFSGGSRAVALLAKGDICMTIPARKATSAIVAIGTTATDGFLQ